MTSLLGDKELTSIVTGLIRRIDQQVFASPDFYLPLLLPEERPQLTEHVSVIQLLLNEIRNQAETDRFRRLLQDHIRIGLSAVLENLCNSAFQPADQQIPLAKLLKPVPFASDPLQLHNANVFILSSEGGLLQPLLQDPTLRTYVENVYEA